jgi:protein-S-isoprenylcysteine O-methyltransferase Ste14
MDRLFTLIPPLAFLISLYVSECIFKKNNINIDGVPPIDKKLLYTAKYLVVVVWGGMCIHAFGLRLSGFPNYFQLRALSLFLWLVGFAGLFIGKATLGQNFRIGTSEQTTELVTSGLYKFRRNPMYISLNLTLIAAVLYTCSLGILFLSAFIIIVHHYIILAEERWLQRSFSLAYKDYFQKVRRYL